MTIYTDKLWLNFPTDGFICKQNTLETSSDKRNKDESNNGINLGISNLNDYS